MAARPRSFQGESSAVVVTEAIRFIDEAKRAGTAVLRRRLVRLAARTL